MQVLAKSPAASQVDREANERLKKPTCGDGNGGASSSRPRFAADAVFPDDDIGTTHCPLRLSLPSESPDRDSGSSGSPIFSNGRWAAVGQAGAQVIRFGVSVILARLLAPEDFGLMAMAIIVIGFIDIFKDLGTVSAIVQRREVTDDLLSSLFFFNVLLGACTSGVVFLAAPVLVQFYGHQELQAILRVLACVLLISSFGLVKKALLQKRMRFDVIAKIDLSAAVVQGSVTVFLGVVGWKVWALVVGAVIGSCVSTVFLWFAASWKPQLLFKWSEVRKVFNFSLNLTGSQVLNYFLQNTDAVIVGRFLGASPLGFYALVQRLLLTPLAFFTSVAMTVLFPALSAEQGNNSRIGRAYLRACGLIALITFPILGGAFSVARPMVLAVFGENWTPVIGLIQILAPAFIIQSIATTVGVIYLVKGRTDWLLRWQLASGAVMMAGLFTGLQWGIMGVASGYAAAIALLAYPAFAIPFRLVDIRFADLLAVLRPYGAATAIMVSVVLAVRWALETPASHLQFRLPFYVIVGAVSYVGTVLALKPPAVTDFTKLLKIRSA